MATPYGGNNGHDDHDGAADEGDQAEGNNNVTGDGSEDNIVLDSHTMTDVFSMQPLQNGEWFGVHEGGPWNGISFAGLESHLTAHSNDDHHSGLSANDVATANLETPHVPLNSWLQSNYVPILLYLVLPREPDLPRDAYREERAMNTSLDSGNSSGQQPAPSSLHGGCCESGTPSAQHDKK
ncbi:hypothetical protein O988_03273 [Pseudogymnoascus sp. VKM F-3808]|nr:hypothetical protein O988_03273 [Pseudogymnoascus sp. VKM F-3808]